MTNRPSNHDATEKNLRTIAEMERAVQQQRTRGESVADLFSDVVGSWGFIGIQTALLILWLFINLAGLVSWDPYPFILLNLLLSFQAAYASPILLMSQNRQARLATRRNHLDLQINMLAEEEATEILRLLHALCEKSGIDIVDSSSKGLDQPTEPKRILQQIKTVVERNDGS